MIMKIVKGEALLHNLKLWLAGSIFVSSTFSLDLGLEKEMVGARFDWVCWDLGFLLGFDR